MTAVFLLEMQRSFVIKGMGNGVKPSPIDWHLAGVAFSCISQSKSPCRYRRRVVATNFTTSNAFLILCTV